MKKLIALVLVLVMALSLMTVASADDPTTGTITVTNAKVGETYKAYKVFDATYNGDAVAYTVKTGSVKTAAAASGSPFAVAETADAEGNYSVTLNATLAAKDPTSADVQDALLGWMEANKALFTLADTKVADATTVAFTGLDFGYYYVTSSLGSLVTIDTIAPEAEIEDKNFEPTIDKEVKEDSTSKYGDENDATIGALVDYKLYLTVSKGTENLVAHDTMTSGLELVEDTITITTSDSTKAVTTLKKGVDYTVTVKSGSGLLTASAGDDDTFYISFTDAYLESVEVETPLVVAYSCKLTADAATADYDTNTIHLTYGAAQKTALKSVITDTYQFTLNKIDKATGDALEGAKFELYDAETDGNKIGLIKVTDTAGDYYRPVTGTETAEPIVAGTGIVVKGLDADVYYLEEILTPEGYLPPEGRFEVDLTPKSANVDVDVENVAGNKLPSTGGIGTTIFYALGGVLVLAAVVFIISRKRMHA